MTTLVIYFYYIKKLFLLKLKLLLLLNRAIFAVYEVFAPLTLSLFKQQS